VSRASRMTAGILVSTALFLWVLSPDVVSLAGHRRSLSSYPVGNVGDFATFRAVAQTGS
jgi:hypothetical protein